MLRSSQHACINHGTLPVSAGRDYVPIVGSGHVTRHDSRRNHGVQHVHRAGPSRMSSTHMPNTHTTSALRTCILTYKHADVFALQACRCTAFLIPVCMCVSTWHNARSIERWRESHSLYERTNSELNPSMYSAALLLIPCTRPDV